MCIRKIICLTCVLLLAMSELSATQVPTSILPADGARVLIIGVSPATYELDLEKEAPHFRSLADRYKLSFLDIDCTAQDPSSFILPFLENKDVYTTKLVYSEVMFPEDEPQDTATDMNLVKITKDGIVKVLNPSLNDENLLTTTKWLIYSPTRYQAIPLEKNATFLYFDFNKKSFRDYVARTTPEKKYDFMIPDLQVSYALQDNAIVELLRLLRPDGKFVLGPIYSHFEDCIKFKFNTKEKSLSYMEHVFNYEKFTKDETLHPLREGCDKVRNWTEQYLRPVSLSFCSPRDKSITINFDWDMTQTNAEIEEYFEKIRTEITKTCTLDREDIDRLDRDLVELKNALHQNISVINSEKLLEFLTSNLGRPVSLQFVSYEDIRSEVETFVSPKYKGLAPDTVWMILSLS